MSAALWKELNQILRKIDRPGSFAVSGSAPVVLPGLKVKGLGPIGLPLTAGQAKELKERCEQAPYGKGEETIVDTSVRRVWRLKPEHFSLTNPDWEPFLRATVLKVQKELGLEKRKLERHLYELLLYEKGSFFLPHRDGEKLDGMVATLVIALPSSFEGGELVVRHEGQERTIDFSSGTDDLFSVHFAAFYADCEHEIRPLRSGHRLCLVYNLTLKSGKKSLAAPRASEHVESISRVLRDWARQDGPLKLAVTLEHQYTQNGLTWDALKGADQAKADVLVQAARRADCRAFLALLTFHESGSAEGGGGYYERRRGWDDYDDDPGDYEMGEVFETSLTADHWSDSQGRRLPFGEIAVEEDELLDPEALMAVEPEEEFEGYTGNAGMTLDRWYRHGAIFLWPNPRHYEVLCQAGCRNAIESLKLLVKQWQQAGKKDAAALRAECLAFASAIIAAWPKNPYSGRYGPPAEPCPLFSLLAVLDDPGLVKAYLRGVTIEDTSADPGKALTRLCQRHGSGVFGPELEVVFQATNAETIERNFRLLEQLCTAKPRKKEGWAELCGSLARIAVRALEEIDRGKPEDDFRARHVDRAQVLGDLVRSLLATEQYELLSRVVTHTLANAGQYPLTQVHMKALATLEPWLKEHVGKPCPALADWIASCRGQLEALTAKAPQAPADFRRDATMRCTCADCGELRRFLASPNERIHRFPVAEHRRQHLEDCIRGHHCDLDCTTERKGRPYSLVCTKNDASYKAKLKTFHQDQEHLAMVRSIQKSLPM